MKNVMHCSGNQWKTRLIYGQNIEIVGELLIIEWKKKLRNIECYLFEPIHNWDLFFNLIEWSFHEFQSKSIELCQIQPIDWCCVAGSTYLNLICTYLRLVNVISRIKSKLVVFVFKLRLMNRKMCASQKEER